MNDNCPVVDTWFDGSKRPSNLDTASFVIGGTHLLHEFFGRAGEMRSGGQLIVVAPFIESNVIAEIDFLRGDRVRQFDLMLITTPRTARSMAANGLASLGWRSCEIRALRDLHAKLYAVVPVNDIPVAVIGSHNLTAPGVGRNAEMGLLISGSTFQGRLAFDALVENVSQLRAKSTLIHDSFNWPPTFGSAA
jgi:hypothetical protein